jgi:outer membrane murein-binding lipoprotein Lpp
MIKFRHSLIAVLALSIAGCSSTGSVSAADVNTACQKVREVNREIADLKLDEKGAEIMKDSRVNDLLKKSAEVTKDLASKVDSLAAKDKGAIGSLRDSFTRNKELLKNIGSFIASESIDEARDKARKLRKLADLIGAKDCAPGQ